MTDKHNEAAREPDFKQWAHDLMACPDVNLEDVIRLAYAKGQLAERESVLMFVCGVVERASAEHSLPPQALGFVDGCEAIARRVRARGGK